MSQSNLPIRSAKTASEGERKRKHGNSTDLDEDAEHPDPKKPHQESDEDKMKRSRIRHEEIEKVREHDAELDRIEEDTPQKTERDSRLEEIKRLMAFRRTAEGQLQLDKCRRVSLEEKNRKLAEEKATGNAPIGEAEEATKHGPSPDILTFGGRAKNSELTQEEEEQLPEFSRLISVILNGLYTLEGAEGHEDEDEESTIDKTRAAKVRENSTEMEGSETNDKERSRVSHVDYLIGFQDALAHSMGSKCPVLFTQVMDIFHDHRAETGWDLPRFLGQVKEASRYVCVADFPRAVTVLVRTFSIDVDQDGEHFDWFVTQFARELLGWKSFSNLLCMLDDSWEVQERLESIGVCKEIIESALLSMGGVLAIEDDDPSPNFKDREMSDGPSEHEDDNIDETSDVSDEASETVEDLEHQELEAEEVEGLEMDLALDIETIREMIAAPGSIVAEDVNEMELS
ncbi:hypothetical protein FKW77_000125 [Venturia effusa]|uniref:Uncharacterized protein n=1 Tax=Venturia effusa TaxID=50376 RepID=A0A517L2I2_9PEZI|nr:hypothetical protein FKW77_000125 [Venturia effusa]